jgi:cell division protein FtsN
MAKQKKGDNYEMILESRHLLGVFFAVVLLCALFFTLGFVLGRSQAQERAKAAPAGKPAAADEATGPAAKDLTFYDRVEGEPAEEGAVRADVQPAPATTAAPVSNPVYLQVAALSQEADAKRLSQKLLELGFPVVIRPPGDDRLYRVQVGPFQTNELADAAQRRLQAQGFRQIVRR